MNRTTIIHFKPESDKPKTGMGLSEKPHETDRGTGEGDYLVCRRCLFLITHASEKIEVNGAHSHGFTNPHGLYFDVGCFRNAPGCVYSNETSHEFTWFPGFSWQIAACRSCLAHLGWLFVSSGSRFNGLILDNLMPWRPEETKPS